MGCYFIMEIKRIIYYQHLESQDGFDPEMEEQYETEEAIVLCKEERINWFDGRPYPYTVYIVREIKSKEIKVIDAKYIKKYIID